MKYVLVEGQCHGGVSFLVCILVVGFLWLAWKFEANQFWPDDLADITKIFYFAYGFTSFLAVHCASWYFSGICCSSDITIDAAPHRAASADALALTCVPATFGAEY
jgi:hypothetical protein